MTFAFTPSTKTPPALSHQPGASTTEVRSLDGNATV